MKINPKARCPCGSHKRYRDCCAIKKEKNRMIFIIGGIAFTIVVTIYSFTDEPSAPPGKVWSPEHQHYHDIGGNSPTTAPIARPPDATTPSNSSISQPPGPALAGKVWSPEHGHWHDSGGNSPITSPVNQPRDVNSQIGNYFPQPPGPVLAGKVWSTEHAHWHDVQ